MNVAPIGSVRTPFDDHDEAPRQGIERDVEGRVELDPAYADGLAGLSPGDPLIGVWFADRANRSTLLLDRDPPRGVFTTRSQDRPNPICLTGTVVTHVDGRIVHVRGVDMLDGTPVLDLKPPLDRDAD